MNTIIRIISSIIIIINIATIGLNAQIYLGSHHIIHEKNKKTGKDDFKWKDESKETNSLYRNITFDLKFADNCKYIIPSPYQEEQLFKQKIMTFCTSQDNDGKNSLRVGWCYDPDMDKIRLAFYAHINHLGDEPGREQCYLEKEIDCNQWCHVEMAIGKKGMMMSIDDQAVVVSRNIYSWSPDGETTYVRANSYFEYGDCGKEDDCHGAVQDMDIYRKCGNG